MASRPPNQHVSNPSPKTTNIATKSKNAALQQTAEKAVVHTKEGLQFIEGTGDYDTKLDNEKEHHTIRTWLKEALRLAYLSPALKESIKRLLASNDFTANMTTWKSSNLSKSTANRSFSKSANHSK